MVDGNLNITQEGHGAQVALCYTLCTDDHVDAVMELGICKYGDQTNKKGLTKIITTKSLSMDANINENPSCPNFYFCFKLGAIENNKKTIDHIVNSTYILEDKMNKTIRVNLYAVSKIQCYPISATYNLGSPEKFRALLKYIYVQRI